VIAVTSTDGRVLEPEPVPAELPAGLFVSVAREAFDALATESLHHKKAAGTAHAKPKEHEQHTELARYGTASAACSLLLQHRNATVHNNESGASVTADAWTNVQQTFRATYSLFRDSCLSPGTILCAAAHYRKDWRLWRELDRIGLTRLPGGMKG